MKKPANAWKSLTETQYRFTALAECSLQRFVSDNCLGKTVYLNIDDEKPQDNYDRTLAIVYTENMDINKELLDNNLAQNSYFEPSEFKKGEV